MLGYLKKDAFSLLLEKRLKEEKMKRITKVLILSMIMTLMLGMTAQAAVKKVTITAPTKKTSYTVTRGKKNVSKKLKVTIKRTSKKDSLKVVYKSSNPTVVSVNSKGVMTFKKAGKAKITVSSKANPKRKDTLNITVKQAPTKITATTSDGLTIKANKTISVSRGKSITVKSTVLPTDASSKAVTYKSSKSSIAKVNSKGKITAGKKSGVATITITSKADKKVKFKFKVKTVAGKVTSVNVDQTSVALALGGADAEKTATVKATVKTSGKSANKTLAWQSADSKVATVSQKGVITAVAPGTTKVTVSSTDGTKKKQTITVTVSQKITSLTVDTDKVTLATDAAFGYATSVDLKATVAPDNATLKELAFTSSDDKVAKVDAKGTISAVAPGTAKITVATKDGSNITKTVEVNVVYGKKLTANPNAFEAGINVTGGNKSVAFANPQQALTAANQMTKIIQNEGFIGADNKITFTVNGNQYVLAYGTTGYSLKNAAGTDIALDVLGGKVVGDFKISKGVSADTFNKYLSGVQTLLDANKLAGTYEFGNATVVVGDKTFAVTNLTVTNGVITATVDGDAVTAKLTNKALIVTSTGSLDEAVAAMKTILAGSFTE